MLIHDRPYSIEFSELASGLATLEFAAGTSRKNVRKYLRASLHAPTENALAQAIWSSQEIGLDFNLSEHLVTIANAYEARARTAYDKGDYLTAANEGWYWLQDQHLSPVAATFGAFVCLSLLADYGRAHKFAELGLKANPNNALLINSKIISLAMSGKTNEAAEFLPRLELFESDPNIRPFVYAAHGLVAFRQGNPVGGRDWYRRAVESAAKSPRPSLAANATIYWLEQELLAGTISTEEAATIFDKLNAYYDPKKVGSGNSTVWIVRRKNILGQIEMQRMRQNILNQYSYSRPAKIERDTSWMPNLLLPG
jgi:hypothetical protein